MGDSDPGLVLAVITSPSRAFERLGSGDYLVQAAWVLAVASVAGVLPLLPFSALPLESKFGLTSEEAGLPVGAAGVVEYAAYGAAGGLISASLAYAVGRSAGGRGDWRRVFVLVLHAYAPAAVVSVVLLGPAVLIAGEIAASDPVMLQEADDDQLVEALAPLAGYVVLMLVVGAAALVWTLAVTVRAVMHAHFLGHWAAIAVVIAVKILSTVALAALAYALG